MSVNLAEKIVVITGASTGIGAALASAFAARGATVVLVARSEKALTDNAAKIESAGGRAVVIAQDLSLPDAATTLMDRLSTLGLRVDILVNNAGFGSYGDFVAEDRATLASMIALNIRALTELTHAALPQMLARGSGAVLNMASVASFMPVPRMAVYAATKAYVLSFSEALWAELRGSGVLVSAICPGPIETPFYDVLGEADRVKRNGILSRRLPVSAVVKATLAALDSSSPSHVIGLSNRFVTTLPRLIPRRLQAWSNAKLFQ